MRSFLRDTLLVFQRAMRLSLRNPVWVILGLVQPVLYLSLFGPLLRRLPLTGANGGPDDNWRVFVPGLLIQLGLFGAAFVGFGLVAEYRAGVIDRQRVSPASRMALLLGRVLRDVVVLVVQAVLLVVVAVPFGLRVSVVRAGAGIGIVAVLCVAFASFSYAMALRTKSEDALAPLLNGLAVPLLLLSGILLPMTLAPRWLRDLSNVNPVSHVVNGVRELFLRDGRASTIWWGLVAATGMAVASVWYGARVFKRESS